jgi:hypothetical protein
MQNLTYITYVQYPGKVQESLRRVGRGDKVSNNNLAIFGK